MKLERQLKLALDESRLLILGSQVLFGFQFNGIFQQKFADLPSASRGFVCAGLPLLMVALALQIAPSMHHRIVEGGQDSRRVLALATLCAGWALLPVAVDSGDNLADPCPLIRTIINGRCPPVALPHCRRARKLRLSR